MHWFTSPELCEMKREWRWFFPMLRNPGINYYFSWNFHEVLQIFIRTQKSRRVSVNGTDIKSFRFMDIPREGYTLVCTSGLRISVILYIGQEKVGSRVTIKDTLFMFNYLQDYRDYHPMWDRRLLTFIFDFFYSRGLKEKIIFWSYLCECSFFILQK